MMAKIYSAAAVTIVATAGDHSDYGLPGVGGRSRITPPSIRLNGTTWAAALDDFKAPIRESPWAQRAWWVTPFIRVSRALTMDFRCVGRIKRSFTHASS
jgi:hypothetical protein